MPAGDYGMSGGSAILVNIRMGGAAGESTRIEASGRSGGVLLAWNEGHFELLSSWSGRHLTAARLAVRADGSQQTVVSAYVM